jgi:hypothetical protein
MENLKVFLELDSTIIEKAESNGIDYAVELKEKGILVQVENGTINLEVKSGARTRDIVPIIIAGTAAIGALSYAISTIIRALNGKPIIVELDGLEELRDADNNVILGPDAKPIFKTVKSIQVVDPAKNQLTSFDLVLMNVFKIKISSK